MSIYDKASLVLIPSGTKTSKVYSQKPTNGDGDFTFSRSTAATRVNASGNIEKETQNLLLQSNGFSTSPFTTSNTSVTGGQAGYDGTNNAWSLTSNGTNGFENLHQIISFSGVYTISVYAKQGSNDYLTIRTLGDDLRVQFKLDDGTHSTTFGSPIDTFMEDAGGGWYRCGFTANFSSATYVLFYPQIIGITTAGSIYIQDAQLEQGLVARDYIETTTTAIYGGITDNVPRLDYTDSSCPALLLEPQRTNLFDNSEYIEGWSTSNTGATIEENATTSPEGVVNAAKIKEDGNNAAHAIRNLTGPTLTSGTDYTFSFFAKKGERSIVALSNTIGASNDANCFFDLENVQVLTNQFNSASIEDFGNGWYRCIATDTADAADDYDTRIYTATADNQFSHQGVSGNGLYIYGLQLEAGSYATSYIPTYGSAVTRNADEFSIANQPQLFGDSEGTLFIDRSALGIYADYSNISLNSGNFTNSLGIRYNPNGNSMLAQCRVNNANEAFLNHSVTDITDRSKAAFGYKTNDFVFYVDGSSVGTETSGNTFPDGTITHIRSSRGDADDFFYGRIYQILVFTTRLTNAELADLTTL